MVEIVNLAYFYRLIQIIKNQSENKIGKTYSIIKTSSDSWLRSKNDRKIDKARRTVLPAKLSKQAMWP